MKASVAKTKTYGRLTGLFVALNRDSQLTIDEQWSIEDGNFQISDISCNNIWWSEEVTCRVYEAVCEALAAELAHSDSAEWSAACDRAATLAQWGDVSEDNYTKETHCDHGRKLVETCDTCENLANPLRVWHGMFFAAVLSLPFWLVILIWLFGAIV